MPSSSTRGRVARANGKDNDQEAESEGFNSLKTIGGQPSANISIPGSSPSAGSGSGGSSRDQRGPNSDDMDGLSSGNDSGERESEGGMERGSGSRGRQSTRSSHSSSNGKDSGMMLETTESNKRWEEIEISSWLIIIQARGGAAEFFVWLKCSFLSFCSSNSQSLSPPSCSVAYSTSGCSSDQSARAQTQKELMKAIKELKLRLPSERKSKGHSSTLNALKYALQCVRQVRGEHLLL